MVVQITHLITNNYERTRALSYYIDMNINGRDITAADLVKQIDMLREGWCNLMYKYISIDETFLKDMPVTNYTKRQLINELIEHFTETEEYEKCAELVKLKRW